MRAYIRTYVLCMYVHMCANTGGSIDVCTSNMANGYNIHTYVSLISIHTWLPNVVVYHKRVTGVCYGVLLLCGRGTFCLFAGRTLQRPEYVGLVGLVIGIGEIMGGAIFGIFGKHTRWFGRDPIVILGMLLHMVSFLLIFYTIPNNATKTLHPDDTTFLIENAK